MKIIQELRELSHFDREALERIAESVGQVSNKELVAWYCHARDHLQSRIREHVVCLLTKEIKRRGLKG